MNLKYFSIFSLLFLNQDIVRNASITVILRLFDIEQLKRLELFIVSPYFNYKEDVCKFIEYHIKTLHANLSKSDTIQQAFDYVSNGTEYNESWYFHLNECAIKTIEDFIIVEANLNNNVSYMATLLTKYGEWNIVSEYEAVSENLEKFLFSEMSIDHNFIQYLYQIFLIKNTYSNNEETKKYDELINSTSDKLDKYYMQTKLRIAYEIYKRNIWRDSKITPSLLSDIVAIVEKYDYRKEKYINMYYVVLQSILDPDQLQHYYDLKDLLVNNSSNLIGDNRFDLFGAASNYCALKINAGNQSFRRELFDLYKAVVDANALLVNGEISAWLFSNIVTVAGTLMELEWAEKFINDYNKFVVSQWSNTYYYNLAYLEFLKSNIDSAYQLILKVDDQDDFYLFRSKSLLLHLLYEKKECSMLISTLESFSKLLLQNKILNESHKKVYFGFINYLNELVLISDGDNVKLRILKDKVDNDKDVSSKVWLLAHIDQKMS